MMKITGKVIIINKVKISKPTQRRTPSKIAAKTEAVPMSGCNTIRITGTAKINNIEPKSLIFFISAPFVVRNLAIAKRVTSFANSAGWIPNPLNPIQPFVPATSFPKIYTIKSKTIVVI